MAEFNPGYSSSGVVKTILAAGNREFQFEPGSKKSAATTVGAITASNRRGSSSPGCGRLDHHPNPFAPLCASTAIRQIQGFAR
jgi:hypothetical protein